VRRVIARHRHSPQQRPVLAMAKAIASDLGVSSMSSMSSMVDETLVLRQRSQARPAHAFG